MLHRAVINWFICIINRNNFLIEIFENIFQKYFDSGIDVKDITCVLNYDFPRNIEEYVHRVGRTGRAGRTGTAVTFVARDDWKHAQELIDILRQGYFF